VAGGAASGAREPALLRLAAAAAAAALDADHAVLRLRDAARQRYAIRAAYRAGSGRDRVALFRLDRRLASWAVRQRRAVLVRDLAGDPGLRAFAPRVRSALVMPLRWRGAGLGTLGVFAGAGGARARPFDDADLRRGLRLAAHVERALAEARAALPDADALRARLREALRDGSALVLCVARVDNPREIAAGGPGRERAAAGRLARALREELPGGGALFRLGPLELAALLPGGGESAEGALAFARDVAAALAKSEPPDARVPAALAFGYARVPGEDDDDPDALLARARTPRIRTV